MPAEQTTEQANASADFEAEDYTLFDKIMYGGFGYGKFCMPTNIFRYIATIIFPPLGVILKHVLTGYPYIDFIGLLKNIDEVLYCVILTMCFYVPGLIYSLSIINSCDDIDDDITSE